MKDVLVGSLAVGAVIGAPLAGLFLYSVLTPESGDGFFEAAARAGHPVWEATAFFAASALPVCLLLFAFELFLPLGRSVIKHAKDLMLSGWLVGCLVMLGVQLAYVMAVLALGSVVGLVYCAYCLVLLRIEKRAKRAGKRGSA